MKKEIEDIIKISKSKNPNIELLIESAYLRGVEKGIDIFRKKLLEIIK